MRYLYILFLLQSVYGYCVLPGQNPSFTGPPKVEQLSLNKVRVSWNDNIITLRQCVDQFLVKYGIKSDFATDYKLSEQTQAYQNHIDLEVAPRQTYVFELVAREDKGIVGIDWNKAPKVEFRTTRTFIPAGDPPPIAGPVSSSPPVEEEIIPVTYVEPDSEESFDIAGLSVETFAGLIVVLIIFSIIFVGVVYKISLVISSRNAARLEVMPDEEAAVQLNPGS